MSFLSKTSSSGFIHSVKVPRIYKVAASIVKRVVEGGESLKELVYSSKHKNIKGVYALVVETIKNSELLDKIITKSKLLQKEDRLEPWLARILITEMLFRQKELKGESRPIKTIISYKQSLIKFLGKKKENVFLTKVRKPRYVRVNTLRYTPDEVNKLFRDEGWILVQPPSNYEAFLKRVSELKENEFMKDFHIKELMVFPSNAQFHFHELYTNGSIILQDKASCLPVILLQPPANSTVLDMCAAPGVKTTHLSAIMRNKGTIYAIEMNKSRFKTLCKFVKSAGCSNVRPVNMDALLIGRDSLSDTSWYQDVEYILIDPSCSGTGMVDRKNVFNKEKVDYSRIKKLCAFQFKLLLHALTNFPNVKRVVYSTCSVLPVENEKVVEDVLRKLYELRTNESEVVPDIQLVNIMNDSWSRRGSEDFPHGKYCIYSDPDKDQTNGFFVAVFERNFKIS